MATSPHKPFISLLKHPWEENENSIWLASTLVTHRNVEKFLFPSHLELERRQQLYALIEPALLGLPQLKGPFAVPAEALTPLERDFVNEHFLIFNGLPHEAREGSGFVLDDTGCFLALINGHNHVRLQKTDCTGDLDTSWEQLVAMEASLAPALTFAFSQKFGFLTAEPTLCGSALAVVAYVHVPTLIHTGELQDALDTARDDSLLLTGLQGNPEEFPGDLLLVRNGYTLGVSEEAIISAVRNTVMRLVVAERAARNSLTTKGLLPAMKDKISRALGLLKSAYQLNTMEALGAVSLLKLAIELKAVPEMTLREVNGIYFECRRAHLTYAMGQNELPSDIATTRADFLRQRVEKLTLLWK